MRDTSLVYPVRDDGSILLGRKRRGMGYGKWNGFGGKIEPGETMRQCACRELFEECGLVMAPEKLIAAADLYFHQPSDPEWSHGGIVYFARGWKGSPICLMKWNLAGSGWKNFPMKTCGWPIGMAAHDSFGKENPGNHLFCRRRGNGFLIMISRR